MTTKGFGPSQQQEGAPVRWADRPPGDAVAEDRIGQLVRSSDAPPALDLGARARIWANVQSVSPARRWHLAVVRWAVVAVVLTGSGGVIAAATSWHWWPFSSDTPTPPRTVAPPVVKPARPAVVPPRPVADPPPPPAEEPAPPPPRVPRSANAVSGESQLLGRAMMRLRQQGDAAGALADLDRYQARYPQGALRREATIARVDALLLLKRERSALSILRPLPLQAHGRDQELRVIRGELSAAESCSAAVADFDRVLSEAPPAGLAERALYGRAACRQRQGDHAAATADLRQYLQQFPNGRFAAAARRALASETP